MNLNTRRLRVSTASFVESVSVRTRLMQHRRAMVVFDVIEQSNEVETVFDVEDDVGYCSTVY